VQLGKKTFLKRGRQTDIRLESRYFTAVGSSSTKTVADRHKLVAYRNKNC